MKCEGMKIIRNKKRISRKQMSKDLDIPVQTIKQIEDIDADIAVNMDLISKIAEYLNVTEMELIIPNARQKLYSLVIPEGINLNDAIELLRSLFEKYGLLKDSNEFDTFLSEFQYRLGDLPVNTNSTKYSYVDILDEADEDNNKDEKEEWDSMQFGIQNVCDKAYSVYKYLQNKDCFLTDDDLELLMTVILKVL